MLPLLNKCATPRELRLATRAAAHCAHRHTRRRRPPPRSRSFIGSHLIDELIEDEGNEIICVDNCYSGSKSNIARWLGHPRFEFLRHDVTQPLFVEVDQIYHLACPASPVFYQNNPIKTIKTNVLGTMNMLGLAKRCKARMLLTSTSEVYGDPEEHPQREEYWGHVNPIGIRSCYDEGKRLAETLCFEYLRQHGVQIRIARIFNTYGPRMLENDGRVISNFIVQAINGTPITIYGDGSQTRSFCFVSDMVRGLIKLMNGEHVGPINLGNPGEYTILQLAQHIQGAINPNASLVYKPLPSDDPKKRKPDITKAKTLLGWEPTVPLAEGLKATIADFEQRIAAQKSQEQAKAAGPKARKGAAGAGQAAAATAAAPK
jgi:UDP-glucuronate decarboxylase